MKLRLGLVSNSSSASFVLDRDSLADFQVKMLEDHYNVATAMRLTNVIEHTTPADKWQITVTDMVIECSTFMDNFDLVTFLSVINVHDEAYLVWEHSNHGRGRGKPEW